MRAQAGQLLVIPISLHEDKEVICDYPSKLLSEALGHPRDIHCADPGRVLIDALVNTERLFP